MSDQRRGWPNALGLYKRDKWICAVVARDGPPAQPIIANVSFHIVIVRIVDASVIAPTNRAGKRIVEKEFYSVRRLRRGTRIISRVPLLMPQQTCLFHHALILTPLS